MGGEARTGLGTAAHYNLDVAFSDEQIERIVESAGNLDNLQPADAAAWELCSRMASAIADAYSDEDWRYVLNELSPRRAARTIARRPLEDHHRLLMLVEPSRRAKVKNSLDFLAA